MLAYIFWHRPYATTTALWRRQMVLGPGKEFALIVPPGTNVAAPEGWSALAIERVRVNVS